MVNEFITNTIYARLHVVKSKLNARIVIRLTEKI